MHETSAWDEAVDEGFVKGKISVLRDLARLRFGEPDPKTEATLKAINDPDRLARMTEAILRVRTWKGLLAVK